MKILKTACACLAVIAAAGFSSSARAGQDHVVDNALRFSLESDAPADSQVMMVSFGESGMNLDIDKDNFVRLNLERERPREADRYRASADSQNLDETQGWKFGLSTGFRF